MIKLAKGRFAKQAYTGIPEGTFEEEFGRQGFMGKATHFYRLHPSTEWKRVEGNLRQHFLQLHALRCADQTDPRAEPARLLTNCDLTICVSRRREPMPFYLRNCDGDLIYFVHQGRGTIETDYGPLEYEPGDYVVLPRGTNHRVIPAGPENLLLIIESVGEVSFPDFGLLGRHTLFDTGLIETPEPRPVLDPPAGKEWELRVRRSGEYTSFFYDFCPMDVVGWKGDLLAFKLNVKRFRALTCEQIQLVPTLRCTFQAAGFTVSTFVPHPAQTDPLSAPQGPYHRNVDHDEVVFIHDPGNGGPGTGQLGFTPQGLHHGPSRDAYLARRTRNDATMVTLETARPLQLTPEAAAQEAR